MPRLVTATQNPEKLKSEGRRISEQPAIAAIVAIAADTDTMSESKKRMEYLYDSVKDEYTCPDCGIVKKKQNTMHYHMKRCQGLLDFACTVCQQEFIQKHALDTHMRLRHAEPSATDNAFECPFEDCTFTSPSKGNCRTHCMRKHLLKEVTELIEPAENKAVKCKNCLITFASKPHFYYHSIGCVKLAVTDVRHAILQSIM